MAQTKTRAPSGRSKTNKRKSTAKSTPRGKTTKAKARKASTAKPSKNGVAHVDSARKAVEGTAKQAGHSVNDAAHSVGRAASKAKTPLLAGGAAIAGVAGGMALGARRSGRAKPLTRRPKVKVGPKVKIDSHDLAKAAKEVGQFGVDVGQLAAELRRNRESANANGTKRRSPIEVVLQGLTSRSHDS
jgi:hypothetical protein